MNYGITNYKLNTEHTLNRASFEHRKSTVSNYCANYIFGQVPTVLNVGIKRVITF